MPALEDLIAGLLAGNPRALARLLTHIENDTDDARRALAALYAHTGRAHLIGVTGAPGTGKSTLVNALALAYRQRERTVGIIAVDPTSPFSGGAILGDRIRMRDLAGDRGVFIRSMATRGSLGGLARATANAVRALDAAGFDGVLIETVGAGQSEVEIARAAHTTLVVEAPGLGDDVQAIKAGILEIADVLVVNKADRPDARHTVRALKAMLDLGSSRPTEMWHHGQMLDVAAATTEPDGTSWQTPVLETVATTGTGIDSLVETIDAHRAYLRQTGQIVRWERQRLAAELEERLRDSLLTRFLTNTPQAALQDVLDQLATRQIDPHSAVQRLLGDDAPHHAISRSEQLQE
ncbi:MAG: methylmalonyl Co-A mutase-associated GTPase MeaB [Anaerolineae bacterium]|nr:methylmalonyl Co-A mutase-associated GTPase MeaB [Anaerolineae bacterium]